VPLQCSGRAGSGDGREAETFGTILAAGMVSLPDIQTDEDILTALRRMVARILPQLEEVRQGTSEHEIILHTLLTQNVTVEYHEIDERDNDRINRETRSLGGLVRNIVDGGDNPDELRALALLGLSVREKDGQTCLAVPLRHSGLLALLRASRYNKDGAWAGGLKDVPGAVWGHSVRVSGQVLKCVMVPVSALSLQQGDDQSTAAVPLKGSRGFASTTLN
jgi:hypothetical protein